MTTTQMREKAIYLESIGKWKEAADCWADAIRLCPGKLSSHDIVCMTERMNTCRRAIL